MWTFWSNNARKFWLAAGLGLLCRAAGATPVSSVNVSAPSGPFIVNVSTDNTDFLILCFRPGAQPPDEVETIQLNLVRNGVVIPNSVAPASFQTSSGVVTYGGSTNNGPVLPLTFLVSGNNLKLRATAPSGAFGESTTFNVLPTSEELLPSQNPFNPRQGPVTFSFRLPSDSAVKIIITDHFGQKIWETETSGFRGTIVEVPWDGRNSNGIYVASGVYYALLEIDGSVKSKKRIGVVK